MPWLPPWIVGGFERLYPEPQRDAEASPRQEAAEAVSADPHTLQRAGAGRSANLLEMGHPDQGPDIVVGHLAPGEIVVPPSAQTPEVVAALRAALGDDLPAYTVGSGQERRNPVSGLVAFADTWPVRGHPVPGHPNRGGQMGTRLTPRGGGGDWRKAARENERAIRAGIEVIERKLNDLKAMAVDATRDTPPAQITRPSTAINPLGGIFQEIVEEIAASSRHGGFGGGGRESFADGPNPKGARSRPAY